MAPFAVYLATDEETIMLLAELTHAAEQEHNLNQLFIRLHRRWKPKQTFTLIAPTS